MSDDTIKRSDAIKALNREKSDWNCDYNVPIDKCIERLKRVKSADRPQEWIPCSLRSPEKSGEYLVTIGVEQRRIAIGYYSTKYRRWYAAGDAFAWMPLPDPWKGEND